MQKSVFILIALTSLFGCHKDENTTKQIAERGTIVGAPLTISTLPKILIQAAVQYYAPEYMQNVKFDYDVDLIKIDYNTIDPKGNGTTASGLLIVPKNATKPLPLASYQHGTILKKTEVPSQLKGDYQVGLILGTEGYVVACPDYLGMGDGPKLHPYLHAESEATAVIDFLRAVKSVCTTKNIALNDQLFLLGYSQGGHATMAALKMIEEQYISEFNVTACAPMAGPYDLSGTQMNYVLLDKAYSNPGYLAYVIFAYNSVYSNYQDLNSVFVPPYYDEFKNFFNDNPKYDLDTVNMLWPSSGIPSAVLRPEIVQSMKENPNDPFRLALKKNDLYEWAPQTPMLLCHCDGDDQVSYQNTVVAYNSFISLGSKHVQMVDPLQGGTHITCAVPSFMTALNWFNTLKE